MYNFYRNMICKSVEAEQGAVLEVVPQAPAEVVQEESPAGEVEETEPTAAAPPAQVSFEVFKRRVGQVQYQKEQLERQLQEERQAAEKLRKELAEYTLAPTPAAAPTARTYTQAEAEALAAEIARKNSLNARAGQIYESGKEKFGDKEFVDNIQLLNVAVGGLPDEFIETVLDLDEKSAPEFFMELSKDLDFAQKLVGMSGVRQAVAITKFAEKAKGKGNGLKALSNVPPPITPKVGGGSSKSSESLDNPDMDAAKWMELRNKQARANRRR